MPHCSAKQVFAKHLSNRQEGAIRMKKYTRDMVRRRKRRIDYRLKDRTWEPQEEPMLSTRNIQYEMGSRLRGTAVGGIGMMHLVARRTGLIDGIDSKVEVLKRHLFVSRVRSRDEHRLPHAQWRYVPGRHRAETTGRGLPGCAGRAADSGSDDGWRLLSAIRDKDIDQLMASINETRRKVWSRQPEAFFEMAIVDADGTLAKTGGECKEGMDVAFN